MKPKGIDYKTSTVQYYLNNTNFFPNYKCHLIILDNAKSHNNQMLKDAIVNIYFLFHIPHLTNSPIKNIHKKRKEMYIVLKN